MNKPIVFMFSGQGSQYYQMGKELFNNHSIFRNCMLKLDALVSEYIGKSIVNEIYNPHKGISDKFDDIVYTHPAIFMMEYSLCQVFLEMDIIPDYVLGSSLGEYTSAAIAGIMHIEDIVECIMTQAEILGKYCKRGIMISIIYDVGIFYENPQLYENSELTSVNYQSHFVISVDDERLNLIVNFLENNNIIHQILPVSYGFHSSLIDPAKQAFIDFLKMKSFQTPSISFISCLLGNRVTEVYSSFFWDVVRKPIHFQSAIKFLENQHECVYLDLGPAGTLANFLKKGQTGNLVNRCYSIITPFNQELKNLEIVKDYFNNATL